MGSVVALVCAAVGMLSTASALTYSEWIAGYPSLTGASALATADPDGDGIPNLMEFALDGLDPTFGNTQPTVFMRQVRNTDGTYATPTTGRILSSDLSSAASVHGVLKYKKRAGVTGLLYIPQTNQKNLNDWGWGDSAITEWTDSGYTYARTISDMKVWDGRGFMRLKVEVQ